LSRRLVGEVCGFALTTEGDDRALWISGDTVRFRGLSHVSDHVQVDVAVLHLGAVRFRLTGPLRYTMTIKDAIRVVEQVRPRLAIPVHYEGWSHFSEGLATIERQLAAAPRSIRDTFRLLPIGQPADLSAPHGSSPRAAVESTGGFATP
jgi:L-ascorbate metabolism protein UlaG (beta-lactamase superfamily)